MLAMWCVLVLAVGALATGLWSAPYKSFDLDRFFVPKELALHATALLVALPLVLRLRRIRFSGIDVLLAFFLVMSTISALLAPNHWLSARALAITWSSLVVFWSIGAVVAGKPRRGHAIVGVLVIAMLAVVATALAQAYGVESVHFSANRAPGGTLGNRNFVAHMAAIATPLLIIAAVGARRRLSALVATVALAVAAAFLVLSRTRAAWLALAATIIVLLPGVWRARHRWQVVGLRRRLLFNGVVVALSVGVAMLVPNALDWHSNSPYLDSVKSVADYTGGSGAGRLTQYQHSLSLALHHPVFGVGTGNWSVAYPAAVKSDDPSLSDATGMTSNPWPSSDWVAYAAARGWLAVAALVLAWLLLLADAAGQMLRAPDVEHYLRGLALAGVLIAAAIVGLFDAVLLLPAAALVVYAALGALRSPARRRALPVNAALRVSLIGVVAVVGIAACVRSYLMLDAMGQYDRGAIAVAAQKDPGSYRIQMRLAESAQSRGRCDLVRIHAGAAAELYPHAPQPRRMLADCRRSDTR